MEKSQPESESESEEPTQKNSSPSDRLADVIVGRHIPISAPAIDSFITRFATGYRLERLSQIDQVIAVAAAHHRLVWIHPFYDGNGRVARLFSHAMFREIGIGTILWSISRCLDPIG